MYRLVKTCLEKSRGKVGTAGFGTQDLIDVFHLRQDWTTVKVPEDNMLLKMQFFKRNYVKLKVLTTYFILWKNRVLPLLSCIYTFLKSL